VRVGKKAERKARGYWVWISGLLVGAPRALGGGKECEIVFEVMVIGGSFLVLTIYMRLRLRAGIILRACSLGSLS
jgi:hypothetical protein